jgi:hypothetical protein
MDSLTPLLIELFRNIDQHVFWTQETGEGKSFAVGEVNPGVAWGLCVADDLLHGLGL